MHERQHHHITNSATASEDIDAWTAINVSGGSASIATANEPADGIALADVAEGQEIAYLEQGLTSLKIATAAGIDAGDIIATDADGQGVALSGSSNEGNIRANEDAGSDGDLISVYIDIYNNSNVTAGTD